MLTKLGGTEPGGEAAASIGSVKPVEVSHDIVRPAVGAILLVICMPSMPRPTMLAVGIAPHVDSSAVAVADDHQDSALSAAGENTGEAEID